MITSSFQYDITIVAPPGEDTRQAVTLDCDFGPVFPAPSSRVVLAYIGLSGIRQNNAGNLTGSADFSARFIGDFNSLNTPIYSITVPRSGDSIVQFNGLSLSTDFPFIPNEQSTILLPANFQIEFIPGNAQGQAVGDMLSMFVTIGFNIIE